MISVAALVISLCSIGIDVAIVMKARSVKKNYSKAIEAWKNLAQEIGTHAKTY